ncbi:MAG: tetratricopeptide repeat protein [Sedimenticolaceae bacterium]
MLISIVAFGCVNATQLPTFQTLSQQAQSGDVWAMLNMGAAYDNGTFGQQVDPEKAVFWYRKAAQKGLAKAQFALAHSYATGNGLKQSYIKALPWMHQAALQGEVDAMYLLGVMHAEGLGTTIDVEQAKSWLEKAAAQEHLDAADYLKKLQ